jgi:hypothetical protein
VLSTLTIWATWLLIPKTDRDRPHSPTVFIALWLCMPAAHLYGFVTTPDAPLFFFFVLYLLAFKGFTTESTIGRAMLWGVSAALLVYSKYHGGLLILLSLVLRPAVFKKPQTYLAGLVALALLLPHLLWQVQHDFITFDYHLFQRTDGKLHAGHIGLYLVSAAGILHPVLLAGLIYIALRPVQRKLLGDRFYLQLTIALLIFFLAYAFRSRVEAHWIAAAFIPMIVLFHAYVLNTPAMRKYLRTVLYITLPVVLALRLSITLPSPALVEFQREGRPFFEAVKATAADKKVVFVNSYRRAAKYTFYTGDPAHSSNTVWYRKTHYDITPYAEQFHNEAVWLVGDYPSPFFDSIHVDNGEAFLAAEIPGFPVFTRVHAEDIELPGIISNGEDITIGFALANLHPYDLALDDRDMPVQVSWMLSDGDRKIYIPLEIGLQTLPAGETLLVRSAVPIRQMPPGKYDSCITMKAGHLYHHSISRGGTVTVLP